MTGATHAALAFASGMLAGCPKTTLVLLAGGALLPDIDHPQSVVGRILLPVSIPLHNRFGHRGVVHSFWVWSIVAVLGAFFGVSAVGIGAILHIIADCATLSGVRAMTPFSSKVFVLFKREWRIRTGGRAEFAILAVAGTIAWAGGKTSQLGGIGAILGKLSGSPQIMMDEYRRQGLEKCWVKATIRWSSGRIEKGKWLVIGTEGSSGIALEMGDRIAHLPADGRLLSARLDRTGESWNTLDLQGWLVTGKPCYFLDRNKWRKGSSGDVVFGKIIANELVFSEPVDRLNLDL